MSKLNGKVVKRSMYSKGGNTDYTQGQTIEFKFPDTDGFLIPESLNISYTITANGGPNIYGIPLYAPFSSLKTYINENCVEQITNYNEIFGFVIANGLYDAGSRVGMTEDYGLIYTTTVDVEKLNYGILAVSTPVNFSGKLECMLRNFNGPMPFNKIKPQIDLMLDAINIFSTNSNFYTYSITNVEVMYDVLYADLPIYKQLSTFSFYGSSIPIASGSSGSFTLNYNNPKMKAGLGAFVTFSNASSNQKGFESYDWTNFSGSYNLYFNNNQSFPQKTYFTSLSKRGAILTNYKEAIRRIYNNQNLNCYITYRDFNYIPNGAGVLGYPSKFIYGVPLCYRLDNKLLGLEIDSNTAFLQINSTYASTAIYYANLVICYGIDIDITENGLIISK